MPRLPILLLLTLMAAVAVVGLKPSDPRYAVLTRCRDSRAEWGLGGARADESAAACFKELLMAVGPRYRAGRGIPELEISPEDPLEIPFSSINLPGLNIVGNATNIRLVGMALSLTPENTNVTVSTKARKGQVTFRTPRMRGTADFALAIDLIRTLFPGAVGGDKDGGGAAAETAPVVKGRMTANFEDAQSTLFLVLGKPPGGGGDGLSVTNAGLKQQFGKIDLQMVPTFSGGESTREKEQQKALVSLMNTMSRNEEIRASVVAELSRPIVARVARLKYKLLATGFDNIHLL